MGKPPFETETATDTYKRITQVDLKFPDYVREGARDFIAKVRGEKRHKAVAQTTRCCQNR